MIYPIVPFPVTLSVPWPRFQGHGVKLFRPIDALNVLFAQLTRDLFAIAKFLFKTGIDEKNEQKLSYRKQIARQLRTQYVEVIYNNPVTLKFFYWSAIVTISLSCTIFELLDVEWYRDLEIWLRGQSMPFKLVPFKCLGAVSYSPSIVTMAISVAVCKIFSVKEWCELENRVRVRSRSLEMTPFDKSHTSSYSPFIATTCMALSCIILLVKNRKIFIPHLYLAPPQGVTPSEFCEDVWCW